MHFNLNLYMLHLWPVNAVISMHYAFSLSLLITLSSLSLFDFASTLLTASLPPKEEKHDVDEP